MSERAPYSRVYWSILDDPKFDGIRENLRHLGAWCLLLIVADMAWPAPAFTPPGVPKASLQALIAAGLVDPLTGGRFRIHGLATERGKRSDAAAASANARWSQTGRAPDAVRTDSERTANGLLDETRRDEDKTRLDEQSSARDDQPEFPVLQWLNAHGCYVRPGNGYHQKLVTACERHTPDELLSNLERLSAAGVPNGDVKGLLFGAIDQLDAAKRPTLPSLQSVDAAERTEIRNRRANEGVWKRRVEQFLFTGAWDETWGPAPEKAPA